MWANVGLYISRRMWANEDICGRMWAYIYEGECGQMMIYVGECGLMMIYVGECGQMMIYVGECGLMILRITK